MARIRIGISGWRYAPWRGVFYPPDLPQRRELEYVGSRFATLEINGSFHSLQSPASYGAWREAVPEEFVFAVKGPRFITHIKRLQDTRAPLANFYASGVLRLGSALGPCLWQLPPSLPFRPERLDAFLSDLPRTTVEAQARARKHDGRLRHRAWLRIDRPRRLRHALEVRHPSFATPEFIALLRRHEVAVVVADTAGRWPVIEDVTADFMYVRLHGDEELYASGYGTGALRRWARKLEAWAKGTDAPGARRHGPALPSRGKGRDVFVYFDNDVKVHAPYDARMLAHLLGQGPAPRRPREALRAVTEVPRTRWPGFGRGASARVRQGTRTIRAHSIFL